MAGCLVAPGLALAGVVLGFMIGTGVVNSIMVHSGYEAGSQTAWLNAENWGLYVGAPVGALVMGGLGWAFAATGRRGLPAGFALFVASAFLAALAGFGGSRIASRMSPIHPCLIAPATATFATYGIWLGNLRYPGFAPRACSPNGAWITGTAADGLNPVRRYLDSRVPAGHAPCDRRAESCLRWNAVMPGGSPVVIVVRTDPAAAAPPAVVLSYIFVHFRK